jgi:glutamine amidotransferase
MCRLFGLAAPTPVGATFWLLDAPDSLRVQSRREPDGTGIGYYDAHGRPHVDKQPQAAYQDRAFAREARTLRSPTFVGHVRFASNGGLTRQNTHPFEQAGRLFAHNGVIGNLPALDAELGADGALVAGDTDSERWFALITREIASHGGDVAAGISSALSWVAATLPVLSLNFVLITGAELWALRYPETHELHVLERAPGEDLEQVSSQGTRIQSGEAAEEPVVVVASERMDGDPRWRALDSGELLHVDGTLRVRSEVVIDAPPAHPLRLEDLEARARRSQG